MTQEDFYWGAMAAMAEMTAAGTVAFSEMYMGAGEIARAADESGLRAIVGRGLACGSEERGDGEKLRLATDFCGRSRTIPESGFRWRLMPSILVVRRSSPPAGNWRRNGAGCSTPMLPRRNRSTGNALPAME